MKARRITAVVLAAVSVPLVVLGLIDPLEGGMSLILAAVLIAVAWLLARKGAPKLLWVPFVVGAALGALALGLAAISAPQTGADGTVTKPWDLAVTILVWGYRLAVLVVIVGAVVYVVGLIRAARTPA